MKIRILGMGILCLAIGFGIVNQMETTKGQSLYVSGRTIAEYEAAIQGERQEIGSIRDRVSEAEAQLDLYESAAREDDFSELTKNMVGEVERYRMFSGFAVVHGAGVKITIDDGIRPLYEWENENNLLVHDFDLLEVINDLRRSGAEAISVNGQRVVGTSTIYCSGYTVTIDGQVFARPFIIRAIGDGKRMSGSLISPEGYGTSLKNFGLQFSVEFVDDMTLPAYSGATRYLYMKNAKGE